MSQAYSVVCINNTQIEEVQHFGVYQKYPNLTADGLILAWQSAGVFIGGTATIDWNVKFDAVICDYHDGTGVGVYSNQEARPSNFRDRWTVTDDDVRKKKILFIIYFYIINV